MKNKLLLIVLTSILMTSNTYAATEDFYVKANLGWSKLDKINDLKSNNDIFLGIAFGYYIMDNIRLDITLERFVSPKHKKDNVEIKGDINTLLINGFIDVFDINDIKIFLGAGAGIGQPKGTKSGDDIAENNGSAKRRNNFAYAGYLGASYQIKCNMHADLVYSYKDIGKAKKLNDQSFHYKGHQLGVSIRVDI